MANYYILWHQDILKPDSAPIPLLFPNSKTVTQFVRMEYCDIDVIFGLAHELWKPNDILETPKQVLLKIYSKLITEVFDDTLEQSFIGISNETREQFGYVCSLHQLFSGSEFCPTSKDIKKNLLADIVNVVQEGLISELKPESQKRLLVELRDISAHFLLQSFQGRQTGFGFFIARLYAMSYAYAGETNRVVSVALDASSLFGLSTEEKNQIISYGNSIDILECLSALSASKFVAQQEVKALTEELNNLLNPKPILPVIIPEKSESKPYQMKTRKKDFSRLTYISYISHGVFFYFIVVGLGLGSALAIHYGDLVKSSVSLIIGFVIILIGWKIFKFIESIEDKKYQERLDKAFDKEWTAFQRENPDARLTLAGDENSERVQYRKWWEQK